MELIWKQEDCCESATRQELLRAGKKAPKCYQGLGTVLSLLGRITTCYWGCTGGNHMIERVAGRAYSSACASLRLLHFGYYDESLLLTRSIGEIANLLFLFSRDAKALADWQRLDERSRRKKFKPVAVREKLEALEIPLPVDQDRYGLLSGEAAHVTPSTTPQAHNATGRPILGGFFQGAGALLALNELAAAVAVVTACAAKLAGIDREQSRIVSAESVALLRAIGGVQITQMRAIWDQIRTGTTVSPESDVSPESPSPSTAI